ncbi:MAG: hypothetical protein AAF682_22105 [Planctomycetota bacterium]
MQKTSSFLFGSLLLALGVAGPFASQSATPQGPQGTDTGPVRQRGNFDGTALQAPLLNFFPASTPAATVPISGTAVGAFFVKVSAPGGLFEIPVINDNFALSVPLALDQVNKIYLTSVSSGGETSVPVAAVVTQDLTPPSVFIDFPAAGELIETQFAPLSPKVDVAGRVSDTLSGFMGLQVTVNGVRAEVDVGVGTNGTFLASDVPIDPDQPTVIEATASDALGNTRTEQITVSHMTIPAGTLQMFPVSGNGQTAEIETELPQPIVVRVFDTTGAPFPNKLVTFDVTRSNGRLTASGIGDGSMLLQVFTDSAGDAQVFWTLGSDAGCGNNRVEVTSAGVSGTVGFCASAMPAPAAQINVGMGNNQRCEVGATGPEPLSVYVHDGCNGVPGEAVTFTVDEGGGLVNGQSTIVVPTDETGHAEVDFTFGPLQGNNRVTADFAGNPSNPVVFVAYGVERDLSQPTAFCGVVLNNGGQCIGGAVCSLVIDGVQVGGALTDDSGFFRMEDLAASGPAHLIIDGFVATQVGGASGITVPEGSFPELEYETVVVPNAENTLPEPILLPPLNPNNTRFYSTTTDTVLEVEGIEGLQMIVTAGSMTYLGQPAPDGLPMSLNRVNHDDIPMAMPDGAAPPFAFTLQPGGAHFDPPVRIVYPNMSGLAPGSISYFLSFDHDAGEFKIVATGQVSDDGSCIVSDPGAGLTEAGWGCNCPPYSVAGDCENCSESCDDNGMLSGSGSVSVSNPMPMYGDSVTFTLNGTATDSGGQKKEECDDGTVTFTPVPPGSVMYEWMVTKPEGDVVMGTGTSATVTVDECGTFNAQFTAMVDRDCAPGPLSMGSGSVTLEGMLNPPISQPDLTIDFTSISNLIDAIKGVVSVTPCSITPPGDLIFKVQVEQFQQCCADGVKDFEKYSGQIGASLGGFSCSIPFAGVPGVASLNVTFGLSSDVSATVSAKQTCDDLDFCFDPKIGGKAFGGVSGTIGPDGVIGTLKVVLEVGDLTGTGMYCTSSGISGQICIGKTEIVGSVVLLAGLVETSVKVGVFDGFCVP